jgi:hypothetical protein
LNKQGTLDHPAILEAKSFPKLLLAIYTTKKLGFQFIRPLKIIESVIIYLVLPQLDAVRGASEA